MKTFPKNAKPADFLAWIGDAISAADRGDITVDEKLVEIAEIEAAAAARGITFKSERFGVRWKVAK